MGFSPWGCKESDTTEQLTLSVLQCVSVTRRNLITIIHIFEIFNGCIPFIVKSEMLVTQSSLTLCNPMNCSLPNSSVHGILQVRILEWGALLFSRGSSQPRD